MVTDVSEILLIRRDIKNNLRRYIYALDKSKIVCQIKISDGVLIIFTKSELNIYNSVIEFVSNTKCNIDDIIYDDIEPFTNDKYNMDIGHMMYILHCLSIDNSSIEYTLTDILTQIKINTPFYFNEYLIN